MIKGMNHVGISVANLARSVAFYRDLFNMEVIAQKSFGGDLYEQLLSLPGAKGAVATLRRGNLEIELFEFLHPLPRLSDPKRPVCDHGITHFCVEVADIDGEYARL